MTAPTPEWRARNQEPVMNAPAQTPGRAAYEAFSRAFPNESWGSWESVLLAPMGDEDEADPQAGWEAVAQAAIAAFASVAPSGLVEALDQVRDREAAAEPNPAPEPTEASDVRPRADGQRGLDITCGVCGEDYGTNVTSPDEIECVECKARRCPHCERWFGGES